MAKEDKNLINRVGKLRKKNKIKLVMFGAGELGNEIFREARRFGNYELVAVDRYQDTPAGKIAEREYTAKMMDGNFMRYVVEKEKPDVIIPEIEAINTNTLVEFEKEGWFVIPNAMATKICMDRKLLREKLAKEAKVLTSKYVYASTRNPEEFRKGVFKIGFPCLSKAIMSSSGRGTYEIENEKDIEKARIFAQKDARGKGDETIIEEFIDFNTEVTCLTLRYLDPSGKKILTAFCKPVGHYQIKGDYHSSWQSQNVAEYLPFPPWVKKRNLKLAQDAETKIYQTAERITGKLGGVGIFGVEMFVMVKNNKVFVYGNESSARPHDTGMVTYISNPAGFSEGGLHLKAITGRILNIPQNKKGFRVIMPALRAAATHVYKAPEGMEGYDIEYKFSEAEKIPGVEIYHFGKPFTYPADNPSLGLVAEERMGFVGATANNPLEAVLKAEKAAHKILIKTRQYPKWKKQDKLPKHLLKW